MTTAPPMINGVHRTRWIQIGGENFISTQAASPTTIRPRKKMTKTAGPSPASCAERSSPQTSHAAGTGSRVRRAPGKPPESRSSGYAGAAAALTPPINAHEQEKPDDVDEMPIPSRRLEAEVMVGFEMPGPRPKETNDQKGRPDDDVKTVEPGRHEKSRGVDAISEVERGVAVLPSLNRGEADAKEDGQRQSPQQSASVAFDQRMMRPGHCSPR